jgi:hypothetical protein
LNSSGIYDCTKHRSQVENIESLIIKIKVSLCFLVLSNQTIYVDHNEYFP